VKFIGRRLDDFEDRLEHEQLEHVLHAEITLMTKGDYRSRPTTVQR
jgi:hypothetical protein